MAKNSTRSISLARVSDMPLLQLAFRPFFLLGAVFSLVAMVIWGAFLQGGILLEPYGGLLWWHQHEMLFGFGMAIVIGFLLTAVQTWTGRRGVHGWPLAGLVALWLAGRLILAFPPEGAALIPALVDLALLPAVMLVMARPVLGARQWRNLIFVPVLGVLFLANVLMHLGMLRGDASMIRDAAHLTVLLSVLLMVVLGGRVIPFFTARRLERTQVARLKWLEASAIGVVVLLVCLQLASFAVALPDRGWASVALLAAGLNALRLTRWDGRRCLHEPLLWGLHLSYALMCVGLAMWGLAALKLLAPSLALHAITVGGMGTMMMAMMARVSLGHTGRPIETLPGMDVALEALGLATMLRTLIPVLWPQVMQWTLSLSALCWVLAFALFVWHYTVLLARPRADGKPG
ncbi:NnrS family protein [Halomonas elongata]|uniref:NnrS family protein n=1 Tax=Halomonas elongata TaxID=2746 RepID=UPI000DCB72DD|nr:NnrS family protein [Halomonas elongata]RAW08270.1 NnrS family protein [Halomonas elongata]